MKTKIQISKIFLKVNIFENMEEFPANNKKKNSFDSFSYVIYKMIVLKCQSKNKFQQSFFVALSLFAQLKKGSQHYLRTKQKANYSLSLILPARLALLKDKDRGVESKVGEAQNKDGDRSQKSKRRLAFCINHSSYDGDRQKPRQRIVFNFWSKMAAP